MSGSAQTILIGEPAMMEFAARLAPLVRAGDTIALTGDLGAGKTSFARGLIHGLGFAGDVPSPSFTLVQTYDPPAVRLPVWHVDLYRLAGAREADALALGEAGHALTLVEWPERLGGELAPSALKLTINGAGGPERRLTAIVPPSWKHRWPPR